VLAFYRWVEGEGVAGSLQQRRLENWVNPGVTGNGGGVVADGQGMHGFDNSASLTLPANSLLVFTR
jgi:hypothetical protein